MSKWRVDLENIGRSDITRSVEVEADTLPDVEDVAIRECGHHLMSQDIGLMDKTDLTYTVVAGLRPVGKVTITSI